MPRSVAAYVAQAICDDIGTDVFYPPNHDARRAVRFYTDDM